MFEVVIDCNARNEATYKVYFVKFVKLSVILIKNKKTKFLTA
ncbi:hypothetical protein MIDIC_50045 [Alphaproteobacteria bacterium]